MCHGAAVAAFPQPATAEEFSSSVDGYRYTGKGSRKVAILPDIYGCNAFYRGLATHLSQKGATVFLVDPFARLGNLPEQTREAAFSRRAKVADKLFVDQLESFTREERLDGVIGFCLGGLYIFELARRGLEAKLVGLYGFPQGLPNSDPLPPPFDYLRDVVQPFTMLMGAQDEAVGVENISRLEGMAPEAPAMTLKVYQGVGHNFLPLLDSEDNAKRSIARDALDEIERVVA